MLSLLRPVYLLTALALAAATAVAQVTMRTLPEDARRRYLAFVRENVVSLRRQGDQDRAGRPVSRDAHNLLVLTSQLPRNALVKYQLDGGGNFFRAWILTFDEAKQPDKYAAPSLPWSTSPEQGRTMNEVLGRPPASRIGLRPGDPPRDTTLPPGRGQSTNP